jgi:cytochrome P450
MNRLAMQIDFAAATAIRDPYPLLHYLREQDPVHWNPGLKAWCVTRYADVAQAFRAPFLSAERIQLPTTAARKRMSSDDNKMLQECLSLWMVFNDPPSHTRLRSLVSQAFSRRAIESLRTVIGEIAKELLDDTNDACDIIADFAYPLPATVIAEMLGVPRSDVAKLKKWSDDLAAFVLVSRVNEHKHAVAAASLREMNTYFSGLIAERRASPGEKIIDELIRAHDASDRLSLNELIASCVLLLFAGHETTTHFLANSVRALMLHPTEADAFAANTGDPRFLHNALNELLRWDGPSISQPRIVSAPAELNGKRLSPGDRIYLLIAGANRDPEVFSAPDKLDLRRENAAKQLAFGSGIHVCLGAHLARLEGEVALPMLMRRCRGLRLADVDVEWEDNFIIRGMKRLRLANGIAA